MRALLLLALASSAAMADPAAQPAPVRESGPATSAGSAAERRGSVATIELRPNGLTTNPDGYTGIVITPRPHPDARPYPHGMVISPPDTGDRMNVLVPPWAWSPRGLWQRFEHELGTIWDALQPRKL